MLDSKVHILKSSITNKSVREVHLDPHHLILALIAREQTVLTKMTKKFLRSKYFSEIRVVIIIKYLCDRKVQVFK